MQLAKSFSSVGHSSSPTSGTWGDQERPGVDEFEVRCSHPCSEHLWQHRKSKTSAERRCHEHLPSDIPRPRLFFRPVRKTRDETLIGCKRSDSPLVRKTTNPTVAARRKKVSKLTEGMMPKRIAIARTGISTNRNALGRRYFRARSRVSSLCAGARTFMASLPPSILACPFD